MPFAPLLQPMDLASRSDGRRHLSQRNELSDGFAHLVVEGDSVSALLIGSGGTRDGYIESDEMTLGVEQGTPTETRIKLDGGFDKVAVVSEPSRIQFPLK